MSKYKSGVKTSERIHFIVNSPRHGGYKGSSNKAGEESDKKPRESLIFEYPSQRVVAIS